MYALGKGSTLVHAKVFPPEAAVKDRTVYIMVRSLMAIEQAVALEKLKGMVSGWVLPVRGFTRMYNQ